MAEQHHGEMGPFCLPLSAAGIAIFSAAHQWYWSNFSDIIASSLDLENCNGLDHSDHDPFLVPVWFWEGLKSFVSIEPLSRSSSCVAHNPLAIICDNPTEKCLIVAWSKSRAVKQRILFYVWSAHKAHTYGHFYSFSFALNDNYNGMPPVEFWGRSCRVVRGSVWMAVPKRSFSISSGWLHCSLSRFLSLLQNFLNHHYTLCLVAVPGPNVFLVFKWSQLVCEPLWTWIRKSLKHIFCLKSFP